jgi:hypothetical protein
MKAMLPIVLAITMATAVALYLNAGPDIHVYSYAAPVNAPVPE